MCGALPECFEDLVRCGGAEIGGNEGGLQIVQSVGVDLFVKGYDLVDALTEVLARARDRLLHAIEKAWLFIFFLVEAAEKSLNHEKNCRGNSIIRKEVLSN